MGVTKLWTVVQDAGKPVRLESLRNKMLAIDASIWIYQFLKAVRNKEGAGLHGSHIVGFFRRICKLLYFGIKPVFVFDGGAPILKLATIARRRERREGQRQSAKGTAQKLLLMKLQQQSQQKTQDKPAESANSESKEGQYSFFRKEDEYHLPEIESFQAKKSDGRIVSSEDYRKYMESLDNDLDDVDLNTIDPASDAFSELPLEKQYIILHKLRLKSRLRMGYSKEQLQEIFPHSMEFSKFQVQMVTKRNYLTQKLLNVVGLDDTLPDVDSKTKMVAGDHTKSYTLVRNKNGWSLSLDNSGTSEANAINLDGVPESKLPSKKRTHSDVENEDDDDVDDDDDDDFEWEDVKIEPKKPKQNFSLNFLPLRPADASVGTSKAAMMSLEHRNKRVEEELEQALVQKSVEASLDDDELKYQEELKKAVEASKKELEQIRKEHDAFLEDDLFEIENKEQKQKQVTANQAAKPALPKFKLGSSIFNKKKSPVTESKESVKAVGKEVEKEKKEEKAPELPVWFENNGGYALNKTQQATNVVDEKVDTNGDELIEHFHFHEQKDEDKLVAHDDQIVELRDDPIVVTDEKMIIDLETEPVTLEEIVSDSDVNRAIEVVEKPSKEIGDSAEVIEEPVKTVNVALEKSAGNAEEVVRFVEQHDPNKVSEEQKGKYNEEQQTKALDPQAKQQIIDYEFAEEEEDDIVNDLQKEEESNNDFTNTLRQQYRPVITTPDFSYNEADLRQQHRRELRDSDEVTDSMIEEVKDLLTCFGIPFITAPMEAEAQCAKLLEFNLVDGIVTDDSDCFLFGGTKIYRHMFTEKKFAELYLIDDITEKVHLTRDNLIDMAYLLGSDYTEGLKGIGPVYSQKILKEFGNLKAFRDWCIEVQRVQAPPKKLLDTSFKRGLRKRLISNEIYLDGRFPDPGVRDAYLNPEVDDDKTKFVWGAPDLDMLRTYLTNKIGWSKSKIDEILVPLIRRYNSPW